MLKTLANALLFQLGWFACVLSPHWPWLLAVPVLVIGLHLAWIGGGAREARLLLGVLISAHSSYVRRGGQMKLAAVDHRIQNIFVITKLSMVFDVYPTEELAIASFAERESV
jgi:hypothetical protein